jgi:group I intron endonuclease
MKNFSFFLKLEVKLIIILYLCGMNIQKEDIKNIHLKGVYIIKCLCRKKIYIGSTTRSFNDRYSEHYKSLKNNCHKNIYLQNAVNKYGLEYFEFHILEIINDIGLILIREQYYLDLYEAHKKSKSYNINCKATGSTQFDKETYKRRAKTLVKTNTIAHQYYEQYLNNMISIENIPKKYVKIVKAYLDKRENHWAKGKTIANGYDWSFLKGNKKTLSEKTNKKYKEQSINSRENRTPNILVYDYNGNYLKTFRSATDIEEFSLINKDFFPLVLRNKSGRNGKPFYYLSKINVTNNCKKLSTHYKGLQFRYENSKIPVINLSL